MKELVEKVKEWGVDKGLDKTNPRTQVLKIVAEFGELADAIAKQNKEEVKDAGGDVAVTIIVNNDQLDLPFTEPYKTQNRDYSINEALVALGDIHNLVDIILTLKEDYDTNYFPVQRYEEIYKEKCNIVLNFVNQVGKEFGLTFKEMLDHAYNEIKDRTGYTNENGTFIKDEVKWQYL